MKLRNSSLTVRTVCSISHLPVLSFTGIYRMHIHSCSWCKLLVVSSEIIEKYLLVFHFCYYFYQDFVATLLNQFILNVFEMYVAFFFANFKYSFKISSPLSTQRASKALKWPLMVCSWSRIPATLCLCIEIPRRQHSMTVFPIGTSCSVFEHLFPMHLINPIYDFHASLPGVCATLKNASALS